MTNTPNGVHATVDEPTRESVRPETGSHRQSRRRTILVRAGVCTLVVLAAAGVGGWVLAQQVSSVRSQLNQTLHLVPKLSAHLEAGENVDANETLDLLREGTVGARETATGGLWKVASAVPFVGSNFSAVTEVAVTADDLVARAMAPLLDEYDSLDWGALSPTDGRIDVAQLRDAAPSISTAEHTVRLSHERLASIELSKLMPQVADPIRSATEQLQGIGDSLAAASSAARLLPSMLGADGPRNYLVLVQNSAETRATGGIPGALAILKTDDGRIALGEQSSANALGAFKPSIEVDPEQTALYTSRLGTQMQNVNLTPDFPTAASTAKQMWEERHEGDRKSVV